MLRHFGTIRADPGLRLTAILLFLFGCVICSVVPYQSLIGIERFGIGTSTYALLLAGAAAFWKLPRAGVGVSA